MAANDPKRTWLVANLSGSNPPSTPRHRRVLTGAACYLCLKRAGFGKAYGAIFRGTEAPKRIAGRRGIRRCIVVDHPGGGDHLPSLWLWRCRYPLCHYCFSDRPHSRPDLILAFEITPEGLKKEKDVDRSQSIIRHYGRCGITRATESLLPVLRRKWRSNVRRRSRVRRTASRSIDSCVPCLHIEGNSDLVLPRLSGR